MRGRRHKELAALIAERSAPITQFMSSNAALSSSSEKAGPLTSRGLDSSPSVCDASAETPSSSASLKERLVSSYMAKEETLKAEIRWTLHTVEKNHSFHSNKAIDKVFQDMIGDSAIAKKFSYGEKKCSYSLLWTGPLFWKPTCTTFVKGKVDMEDSFVLLFDESLNFITKNKQLDVFVCFWDGNRVVSRYWMSQFLGHATSEDLLEHFNKTTETLDR